MQIELEPNPELHLARWRELCADSELAKLPNRIESDRFGRIILNDPFKPFTVILRTGHEYDVERAVDIEFTPYGGLKVRDMDEHWRFLNVDAIDEIVL
jgi:hypothetical protein